MNQDQLWELLAAVHRMRTLQQLRDQQPGPTMRLKISTAEAEGQVDALLGMYYLPDLDQTPLEGGAQ